MAIERIILLVEDSDLQREVAKSHLEDLGFDRVVEAKDGRDAYRYVQKRKVDLIISDWEMPEMDGLELLGRIRQNDILGNIPFIILTVFDDKEKIIAAVKAGITDYIVKPVERNVLEKKIKNIFG